jgi:hypothetical protein
MVIEARGVALFFDRAMEQELDRPQVDHILEIGEEAFGIGDVLVETHRIY